MKLHQTPVEPTKQYGIYKTRVSSVTTDPLKNADKGKREKYEKQKKADQKMVKAQFLIPYREGGEEEFCYCKYYDDPIFQFRGRDGDVYEVPMGMVRYVNENCTIRPHTGLIDKAGQSIRSTPKPTMRFVPVFE